MEVGQGPNWGCSVKGKKLNEDFNLFLPLPLSFSGGHG
jgi:hypothetical protein